MTEHKPQQQANYRYPQQKTAETYTALRFLHVKNYLFLIHKLIYEYDINISL